MAPRLLHYSDVENAYDDPERVGLLAGTIESLRDDQTVVVGTGDDTAPGVLALRTEGRQALDFFREVGSDFETFGNHDFDFGTEPIREIVAESPQRWLSANVFEGEEAAEVPDADPDDQFADADPTAVVECGDEDESGDQRVGFVGVTDPQTTDIAVGAADLTITNPVEAVREILPSLRERADYVVVLAHLLPEDEEKIAEFDGVDAILGGHVHSERHERANGTLLLRPGANGRVVWAVELGEETTATRHEVADGPRDDAVADALRKRKEATGLTEVVATAEEPIIRGRDRRYGGECRVANLVTDAYRWATGADVSFVQTGGLRDGPPLASEVTVADLIGLSPFGGVVHTVALSGAEVRELVSHAFRPDDDEGRFWWGHFAGLEITYDPDAGQVHEVRYDGDPLSPDADLSVAVNGYVLYQNVGSVARDRVRESFDVQYEVVVDYAREEGLDVQLDGRLRSV